MVRGGKGEIRNSSFDPLQECRRWKLGTFQELMRNCEGKTKNSLGDRDSSVLLRELMEGQGELEADGGTNQSQPGKHGVQS